MRISGLCSPPHNLMQMNSTDLALICTGWTLIVVVDAVTEQLFGLKHTSYRICRAGIKSRVVYTHSESQTTCSPPCSLEEQQKWLPRTLEKCCEYVSATANIHPLFTPLTRIASYGDRHNMHMVSSYAVLRQPRCCCSSLCHSSLCHEQFVHVLQRHCRCRLHSSTTIVQSVYYTHRHCKRILNSMHTSVHVLHTQTMGIICADCIGAYLLLGMLLVLFSSVKLEA